MDVDPRVMTDGRTPVQIVQGMVELGAGKAKLRAGELLMRGALAGGVLAFATSFADIATVQTGNPRVGAVVFRGGFVMIILLGLDLITGNIALLPLAMFAGRATLAQTLRNWTWVFGGNLLGSVGYALLLWVALTDAGTISGGAMADKLRAVAAAKTLAYEAHGLGGLAGVFVRAVLCNWMVTFGVVMGLTTMSTGGRILAIWLPIATFVALGYEHTVVNMFAIPAGMLFGAPISFGQWWLWNQIPATLGNLVGGLFFTAIGLTAIYGRRARAPSSVAEVVQVGVARPG